MKDSKNKIVEEDIENIVGDLGDLARQFNGKTVLITGGAGFLGKYLVNTLIHLNNNLLEIPCKIIVLDNFITGFKDAFEEHEHLKVLERDISKPLEVKDNIDYIMHAASIASPMFYNKYRLETIDVGFIGTKNILELAREKNVRSFLFFSTSEVYGNPDPKFIPTSETYFGNVSCIGPRAAYDEPKRIGETLCVTYADIYNLPIKIVRPFNVFGPGMRLDDGRGAINFVVSALKNEKIPVYGDGKNTRSWTYISDATTGFFKILLSDHNREAFNVGNDEQEIEMGHFAQLVVGLVKDGKAKVHNVEGPNETYTKADPNRRCPDLTKIRTMIGYTPRVNLVNGLKRFIVWVEQAMKDQESSFGMQEKCRVCDNVNLRSVINLGESPLANSLLSSDELGKKEEMFPLEMVYCDNCHLCQLSYVVPPEKMFSNYLYVTSTTETFKKHFASMAEKIVRDFNLKENSLVVDIGSNDGLLLKNFKERGTRVVGVEPAENICEIARKDGIDTLDGFFHEDSVEDIVKMKGKADIITANNVFAHVGNVRELVRNVKNLLKEDGAFIIEVQYLLDTIQKLTFDNIYHEHVSYFCLLSLNEFFKRQDMEVFRVEHVDSHGGSLRVYIQNMKGGHQKDGSVDEFLERERKFSLDKFVTYENFSLRISAIRDSFKKFTMDAKKEGKSIVGYGAPAKATTLLNYYQIGSEEIDYIIEDNPLKQGKTIPGVRIPIKGKESLDGELPDYIYILAWNFADEIMKNNDDYREKGAKFVVPSPELKVV
jgi:nucleoside-diphosphate-sugar epimerase/SAM-dependent methyltransferase